MMHIETSQEIEALAQERAAANGITVGDYISNLILNDDEMAKSVEALDFAMDDVRNGRTMSIAEAKSRIEETFGLRARS
jgi:hypothetical protein